MITVLNASVLDASVRLLKFPARTDKGDWSISWAAEHNDTDNMDDDVEEGAYLVVLALMKDDSIYPSHILILFSIILVYFIFSGMDKYLHLHVSSSLC